MNDDLVGLMAGGQSASEEDADEAAQGRAGIVSHRHHGERLVRLAGVNLGLVTMMVLLLLLMVLMLLWMVVVD